MSKLVTSSIQHPSSGVPNLVLNADGTVDGAAPLGGLVAVKHALFTGVQTNSTASGANFAVTSLSVTHTLADAANKLVISAYFGSASTSVGTGRLGIAVADDGTLITVGASPGSRIPVTAGGKVSPSSDGQLVTMPAFTFVYEPGDTAEHTYTVRAINIDGSTRTISINQSEDDENQPSASRTTSGLVVMEVKV